MTAVYPEQEWVSCWCPSAVCWGFLTRYCEGSRGRLKSPAGTTHFSPCLGWTTAQVLAVAAESGDGLEKDNEEEKQLKTTVLTAWSQVFSKGISLLWTIRREPRQVKTVCHCVKKPSHWKKVYRKRLQRTDVRTRNKGLRSPGKNPQSGNNRQMAQKLKKPWRWKPVNHKFNNFPSG